MVHVANRVAAFESKFKMSCSAALIFRTATHIRSASVEHRSTRKYSFALPTLKAQTIRHDHLDQARACLHTGAQPALVNLGDRININLSKTAPLTAHCFRQLRLVDYTLANHNV